MENNEKMNDELVERLNELEIRFTHQSRLLDELNDVVAECHLRIDQLQRDNQRLKSMVENLSPDLEESPDE